MSILVAVFVAGCAGDAEEYDAVQDIRDAYENAESAMMGQNYRKAIGIFEALQARFPFSDFAKQIQLELMYCYYKVGRQDEAISAGDQFLRETRPTQELITRYTYKPLPTSKETQAFSNAGFGGTGTDGRHVTQSRRSHC